MSAPGCGRPSSVERSVPRRGFASVIAGIVRARGTKPRALAALVRVANPSIIDLPAAQRRYNISTLHLTRLRGLMPTPLSSGTP
jgi:hypothetical protein